MVLLKKIIKLITGYSVILNVIFMYGPFSMSYSQNYQVREFNTEHGLSQPYVYSLTQGNNGYLWIGTGNGLTCYDGYSFQTYTVEDSLADNFINCCFKGKNGIWFGHMNGDLSFYSGKTFTKILITAEEKNMITDIEKGPGNSVWASSYSNGFLLINKNHEVKQIKTSGEDQLIINAFKFMDENKILIGTMNGLEVWKYTQNEKLEFDVHFNEIPQSKITDIIEIENLKAYYIATQDDGIFMLSKVVGGYKILRIDSQVNQIISGIQVLLFDSDSNLWIGTFGKGLFKMVKNENGKYSKGFQFNKENGLSTDYIKVVFEDREGIIWCGNYGSGLGKITKKLYSYFFYDENTIGNNIFSIGADKEFKWIGTEKGLVKTDLMTDKPVKFYNQQYGLPDDKITTILPVNNIIWFGTSQNGIFIFSPELERAKSFFISKGNLENSITSITGNEEHIWIGTKKGLCSVSIPNNNIKWYSIMNGGLPHNTVNDVYLDSHNKVWVATLSNTISVIENGNVNKVSIASENGGFTINSIIEDQRGKIWLGTSGNGILIMGEDSITNMTTEEGLFSDYCYSLVSDSNGNIWVGHKGGISRVNSTDYIIKSFQQDFEITKSYEFNNNASIYDGKGKVWLGFNKGLLSVGISEKNEIYVPPILNIISIRVNDKEIEVKDKIRLAPGRYKLSIDFTGVSLKEPELTRYQYILEGYDDAPIITKSTKVIYPGLSEGQYYFYISAINGDGVVTDSPVRLSIFIKTPLWKLPWFYGLAVFFILLSIIGIMRRREKIIQLEKIKLEEKIKERTREIMEQKMELEEKNLHLGQLNRKITSQKKMIELKNIAITDSISYAQTIQAAVLPQEDIFRENFSDYFILYKPKDIVSGDFYWATCLKSKIIIAAADCTGHGVPGAFMSMLGTAYLNEIVNQSLISEPDIILNQLREKVINALKQKGEIGEPKDGMDIALCTIDLKNQTIQYAGAFNPLYFIQNKEMMEVKADRMPIGIHFFVDKKFSKSEIDYHKGDSFYIFSDGYLDQIGENIGKRFMKDRFKDLLHQNHHKPMAEQKEILEKTFGQWKGNFVQVDDILVIGVKL